MVQQLPAEARAVIKIMPDRALPAQQLVKITRTLRDLGVLKVVLIAERSAK